MAEPRILDEIEKVLAAARSPLSIASICESLLGKAQARDSQVSQEKVSVALAKATSKNTKDKRPRFLRLGQGYGLGSWFSDWPPDVSELLRYILLGNNKTPMHISELTARVQEIRTLKADTPGIVIGSALTNDKIFASFGVGVYGLHGWKKYPAIPNDFHYFTPEKYWHVSERICELLEDADELVRISSPYIDKSTFEVFLEHVPSHTAILIILTEDKQMPTKVAEGMNSAFLEGRLKKRKVEFRRLPDLHSRFLIVDNAVTLVTSADLLRQQQAQKYQYLLVSSDPVVTGNCSKYFETMWQNAERIDLIKEVSEIENTRLET